MNKFIQDSLIGIYRLVKSTGALDTALGRKVFESAYQVYKARLEAGPIQVLRSYVRPGTVVVDIGANIGFYTRPFASWVSDGGKVIAVEPEAMNFARLQHAIESAGLGDVVEMIQAAVSDQTGSGFLEVNPGHPGDHKLGAEGVPVALTTLDDLLAARGWPEVSFIKIDVQGAESRVLAGAAGTLERFRPVLFLELDDQQLRRFGSSAAELLTSTGLQGYTIHSREGAGISAPLTVDQALARAEASGYDDLLLLPDQQPDSTGNQRRMSASS
ncbi:MAG: FkbM family methyltransferase [Isosphaeraceae bacterium]